jgi:TPR repeat protein
MKYILLLLITFLTVLQANKEDKQVMQCKDGNITSCHEVGVFLTTGDNKENQEKKELGLDLLRKACKYQNVDSCDILGDNYYKDKHYQAAKPYLKDACARKVKHACEAMGTMYRDAQEVKQDDVQSRYYYEKACELKSGDACINVAIMYRGGFGVKITRALEKKFYKKACAAGSSVGCDAFKRMDNKDKGIKEPSWFDKLKSLF